MVIANDYVSIAAVFIAASSVMVMSVQIRSNIKLNQSNQTFNKIEELDKMLYHNGKLREVIKDLNLIDDSQKALSVVEATEVFLKYKMQIYEILNFFENLALSVFSKNINKKILMQIYGLRIHDAYEKMHPYIVLIADKYRDPTRRPYQHFEALYKNLHKRYSIRKFCIIGKFKSGG